jgi:histidyl-tRNA synthetase
MVETVEKLSAVKGMADVVPDQSAAWQYIEANIREVMQNYAYTEIRTPILERTQLFKRSIGEVTDIVEKEMFTFPDQNGESLTLRPEGTAGCVRACIEHALLRNQQQQKLWYMGPMFRYEKPQKGRYRQFVQLGVEAFNYPGPDIDAEQLALCARLWKRLGIEHMLELQINSLGDAPSRNAYKKKLIEYFSSNLNKLDEDSKRRLHANPMRILDSKNPEMQELIAAAPVLLEHIDVASKEHFEGLQRDLKALGIKYAINTRIVRGLDYYNRTVFEWVTDKLGSQSAVCAGGRYDSLVGMLQGPETSSVGFAMGLERALLLLQLAKPDLHHTIDCFLICIGSTAEAQRLILAEKIRDQVPHLAMHTYLGSGSLGNLFKKADKSGAQFALIIGDEEVANDSVSIKFLRSEQPQQTVAINAIKSILGDL